MRAEAEEIRSLPGEDLWIAPDDAQHWVRVYQELVEFCELMLTRPELSLEEGHLERRLGHYHSRLRRWREERDRAG
jgi:hypothetical protein